MRHSLFVLGLLAVPVLAACGSDGGGSIVPEQPDAGPLDGAPPPPPPPPHVDGGADAGPDADAEPPPPPDAGPDGLAPLVQGDGVRLFGVTSDGYAVFSLGAELWGVPVAGGAPPFIIAPAKGLVEAEVDGPNVAVYSDLATLSQAGTLSVWSYARGYHTVAGHAVRGRETFSPDGRFVAYVVADTAAASSVGVAATDGSGSRTLLALDRAAPWMRYGARGNLVVWHTHRIRNGGVVHLVANVDGFDDTLANTVSVEVSADAAPLMDAAGAWLWASTPSGAELLSTATGAVAFTDPHGAGGVFDPAGAHVFYADDGGALFDLPTADPGARSELLASGCAAPRMISPDGATLTFVAVPPPGGGTVLEGVSTSGVPAAPWSILSFAPDEGEQAWITSDGRYVVTTSSGIRVAPLGGGPVVSLSSTHPDVLDQAAGAELVLDNGGTLEVLDASHPTVVTVPVLAEGVFQFTLTPAKDAVVYVLRGSSNAGLYATTLR